MKKIEYLEIFHELGGEDDPLRKALDLLSMPREDLLNSLGSREKLVRKYAWAVPCEGALLLIKNYASSIVEIGAGTGYWASLLEERGIDVVAYDIAPHENGQANGKFFPIKKGGPFAARLHSHRALFLCWPPYDDPMARTALLAYRGDTVIYIGEGESGCTGDRIFHEILDEDWEEVEYFNLPNWWGMHDSLYIYKRKKHG